MKDSEYPQIIIGLKRKWMIPSGIFLLFACLPVAEPMGNALTGIQSN
jgi:hypothetical protein